MRILLTIHHDIDPDSGAPGTTFRLAQEYRRTGHEVEVLDFTRLLPPRLPEQMKMVAFPWAVAGWYGRHNGRAFDVVDASTGDSWLLGALRSRRPLRGRSPLLVTRSHGLEHMMAAQRRAEASQGGEPLSWKYPLYHGGYRLWEVAQSLRRADLVFLLNAAEREYATSHLGVDPDRAVLVRNGISTSLLGLPSPVPDPSDEGGRIAVIGSYIPRKGIAYAAAALSEWLPRHPDWAVTFLGTGAPEERVLADYPPSVHAQIAVVPRYANADLPSLLGGHQVHLFPTLSEGAPLSLIEAMACGLVPVVSAVPGPLDVVHDGQDSLVVPPASPRAIIDALDGLVADPDRLQRLRSNAHRRVQSYGWADVAAEQLALYERHLALADHERL